MEMLNHPDPAAFLFNPEALNCESPETVCILQHNVVLCACVMRCMGEKRTEMRSRARGTFGAIM
jgi:hypothetical protein